MPKGISKTPEETKRKRSKSLKGRLSPMRGRRHPGKGTFYSGSKTIYCLECGKEWLVPINSSRKFCGRKCSLSYQRNLCKNMSKKERSEKFGKTGEQNGFYGRHHTKGTKKKLGDRLSGKTYEEIYGIEKANEIKKKQRKKRRPYNRKHPAWNKDLTKETDPRVAKNAEHTSKTLRQRYQDSDFKERWLESHWSRNKGIREEVIQKCIVGLRIASCHPNKFELRIYKILDNLFPDEFLYVGDKRFGKSGTNPDFVHKSGKLIVLCDGIYWHLNKKDLEDTQETRKQVLFNEAKLFIENGLSVLLIWDDGETWFLGTGELLPIQHIISKVGYTNMFYPLSKYIE